MPAGKRPQTNGWQYAALTFIGLFIAVAVVAIVFYIKFEEQKTNANTARSDLAEMAKPIEVNRKGALVGSKLKDKSYMGTMLGYFDEMVSLTLGGPAGDDSAEVKHANAMGKTKQAFESLNITDDPNTAGLIPTVELLKARIDNLNDKLRAADENHEKLQSDFDIARKADDETRRTLLQEKEQFRQQVEKIRQDYNALEELLQQTSEQRVQTLLIQTQELRAEQAATRKELLKTQAELMQAQGKLQLAIDELRKTEPIPDPNAAAFKADGKIILIDDRAGIVHLNIGSDDRVYPGLTFAVYDKSRFISKSGKGKAEIEVFDVGKKISTARIIHTSEKDPIVLDDIVANLIWDSDKTNLFVVAGEFDINDDGFVEFDAVERISALIENWGGRLDSAVSIDTDFIVLGKRPPQLKKPTFEDIEADPMAMQKYDDSQRMLEYYDQVVDRAKELMVPIYNYERFLYLSGYKTQSRQAGAF